ncbi:MAG: hypothetical protein Q9191_003564 [Dirinaria sp. TL-2023a]
MQELPQITLDTTLAELYNRDGPVDNSHGQLALLLGVANSEVAPTSKLARNTKFLYQDSTFSKTPEEIAPQQQEEIEKNVAVKYLSLIPQHDAFAAGNMPVILFDLGSSGETFNHSKKEAERTISNLIAAQRPKMLFFSIPSQISMEEHGINCLATKTAFDEVEGLPLALDLDTHYFLNSKAALCNSGLPRSGIGRIAIPSACTGSRGKWLEKQIARIISRISSQRLPFVLKNQQTLGGGGTFLVSSPEDLRELQDTLSARILPKLLSQVNSSNAHLKPATLILSDMIINPISDCGLTFFVTKSGECVFLSLTQQVVDSTKAWIGSTISYTEQESFKKRFTPIMNQIGAWLSGYGYYGPCGADILESAPREGDSSGLTELNIVDLNVRTSGSLVLGLMRTHFSEQRGLHKASSFSITAEMSRDTFMSKFERRFCEGRMVIVSWYEDSESGVSYGNVLIGAPDGKTLEDEVAQVKEIAAQVCF